jgi:hypothetical protein
MLGNHVEIIFNLGEVWWDQRGNKRAECRLWGIELHLICLRLSRRSFVEEAEVVEVEQKARLGVGAELDVDEVEDKCVSSIRR